MSLLARCLLTSLAVPLLLAAQEPVSPDLASAVRIVDAGRVQRGLDAMLDALADADAVFLGEIHDDAVTHDVELAALRGLADRRPGQVVLTLEMFERDVQAVLDRYLAGEIDEAEFLAHSRPWSQYATAYRPLIELAKERGIPVVAANFPAPLRRVVAGGAEGWAALTEEQRRSTPRDVFPASAEYWEYVDRAVRSHGGGDAPRTPEERRYETQNLWDNAMGEAVTDVLARRPDALVLHVAGGFHVARRDGTVAQAQRRAPEADLRCVHVRPHFDLSEGIVLDDDVGLGPHDFYVATAARARDRRDGQWAVEVGNHLRYELRVPESADGAHPAPLLVWLGDDGARASDGLAYWTLALGDEAAVAAVDPLYLAEEEDLRLGGRWYWTDTFPDDAMRLQRGIERLVGYVTERLPVDRTRVVVAGRGAGATAVLWTALYTGELDVPFVAVEPARTGRLRMAGLPDRPPATKRLHGITSDYAEPILRPLIDEWAEQGIETHLEIVPDDTADALERAVRTALGLAVPASEAPVTRIVHLAPATPTARLWAALWARAVSTPAGRVVVREDPTADATAHLEVGGLFPLDDLRRPGALPGAPGPFGGTTVLIVPRGAERGAWEALAADDPLQRANRFQRTILAFEDGEPGVRAALLQLAAQGRSNVLVVPGVFCADGDRMRALRAAAGEPIGGMSVQWLPGLGGNLARAVR